MGDGTTRRSQWHQLLHPRGPFHSSSGRQQGGGGCVTTTFSAYAAAPKDVPTGRGTRLRRGRLQRRTLRPGWSTGPTVVDGRLVRTRNSSLHDDSDFVGMGTTTTTTTTIAASGTTSTSTSDAGGSTRPHQRHWVLGSYQQVTKAALLLGKHHHHHHHSTVSNFVTGFQWLVYEGKSLADNSSSHHNPTGADRAPRTAVGLDGESNLLLLSVDGCERWYVPYVPTHHPSSVYESRAVSGGVSEWMHSWHVTEWNRSHNVMQSPFDVLSLLGRDTSSLAAKLYL
jgi:Phosphodiester glycosidase